MSPRKPRSIADGLLRCLVTLAPDRMRDWAEAVRAEAAAIPDDKEALLFAAGTGSSLAVTFLLARSGDVFGRSPDGPVPRVVAAFAASLAVMIGIVHLSVAGAPFSMLIVNMVALASGLLMLAAARRWLPLSHDGGDIALIVAAGLLLATSLFGISSHGAVRWVAIGSLMVQASLILLPPMIMIFARKATATGTLALVIAAGAIALQPDRAMASAMFAGLAALWVSRRGMRVAIALAASGAGLVATLIRADSLPVAPYTDGVFTTSWQLHPLLGVAVAGGAALLLLPCAVCWCDRSIWKQRCAVFGAFWLAVIIAAMLGNYPAPLLGYGGSAILGYLLSACLLPPRQLVNRKLPLPAEPWRPQPDGLARLLPSSTSCA